MKSLRAAALLGTALLVSVTHASCAGDSGRETVQDFESFFLRPGDPLAVQPGERPRDGSVRVTFLGTSTLLFDDGETQLMIDGFLTRPSRCEVLSEKIEIDQQVVDAALRRAGVDEAKLLAVLVSHSHYDHALDVADIVCRHERARLYGSSSTMMIGRGGGLEPISNRCRGDSTGRLQEFEVGVPLEIGDFCITVLESEHSPPTIVNDDLGDRITQPLIQPQPFAAWKEGGSFDFLIEHEGKRILVKPGANFVKQPSSDFRADVLFLGTGRLTKKKFDSDFEAAVYAQSVELSEASLVIPLHWDDFFAPLGDRLHFPPKIVDDSAKNLDYLLGRIQTSKRPINFRMLQGYQSIMLRKEGPGTERPNCSSK